MKTLISAAIATLVIAALPAIASAENYANRSFRQQQRINVGINNGTISPREATNLYKRESALNAKAYRDLQDGNGLTRTERYNLNRRYDNISRSIYQDRRN